MANFTSQAEVIKKATAAAVTVDTTPDVVLSMIVEYQARELGLWVSNGTAEAMNACLIEVQPYEGSAWFTLNSAWSAAGAVLQSFSVNLATLNNAAGVAWLKLPPVYAIRLSAGVAANTAAISARFFAKIGA